MQMFSSGMFSAFFPLFPNIWLYSSLPNRHSSPPHPTPQLTPSYLTPSLHVEALELGFRYSAQSHLKMAKL
jgi:hypothetical protein